MRAAGSDPLAGFQFNTIGQGPSLLSRISEAEPDRTISPSPSPLSSPKEPQPVSGVVSTSRLISTLAPELPHESPLHEPLSNESPPVIEQSHPVSMANGLPPRPSTALTGSSGVSEQRRTPTTAAQGPSRTSTSTSITQHSSAHPQRPPLAAITTRALSATSGMGASNVGITSPALMNTSMAPGDDPIDTYRQQLRRLEMELKEYRQREEESRQAVARQQDQAARWHARAETVVENMASLLAAAEQRVRIAEERAAQLVRCEEEATQRADELREARTVIARLEKTNAALRQEVEEERNRAKERQRLDELRVTEALTNAQDALKKVATQQHERELGDALIRKRAQEDRARWEAKERELVAQLEDQKRKSDAYTHTLEQQVTELQRAVEIEQHQRSEDLYEERLHFERRERELMAQITQLTRENRVPRSSPTSAAATAVPAASTGSPMVPLQHPAASGVSSSAPTSTRRVQEPHTSTAMTVPQGSIVSPTCSTREGKLSAGFPDPIEPLLAIKVEDEKPKFLKRSSLSRTPAIEHLPTLSAQEPRREQSLDYVAARDLPTTSATPGSAKASPQSSTLSGTSVAAAQAATTHPTTQPLSLDISLGAHSPDPVSSHESKLPLFLPSLDSSLDDIQSPAKSLPTAAAPAVSTEVHNIPSNGPVPPSDRSVVSARIRHLPPQQAPVLRSPVSHVPPPPPSPIIQRGPSDGQQQPWNRRSDHYSPEPASTYQRRPESPPRYTRGSGDHWSSNRDRSRDAPRRQYTPPVRHKRTRDDDIPSNAPEARRARITQAGDYTRPGPPPLSERITSQSGSGRPMRRTPSRSPSPSGYRRDLYSSAYEQRQNLPPQHSYPPPHQQPQHPFSYQEQQRPRRDGARTPASLPDDPMPQYDPPAPPAAMSDTEARSSPQVDVVLPPRSQPQPQPQPQQFPAHAGGANAQPWVAPAYGKKPPPTSPAKRNAPPGPRDAPVGQAPHAMEQPGAGNRSLLARMNVAGAAGVDAERENEIEHENEFAGEDAAGGGDGGNGSYKRPRVVRNRLPQQQQTSDSHHHVSHDEHPGGRGRGANGRGGRARGRGRGRGHPTAGHGPNYNGISSSTSLGDRLSSARPLGERLT